MKLRTYYLAMFSDKKYLSEDWSPELDRHLCKKAKRKNAIRFNTKLELKQALQNYYDKANPLDPYSKVIVLEELVIDDFFKQ